MAGRAIAIAVQLLRQRRADQTKELTDLLLQLDRLCDQSAVEFHLDVYGGTAAPVIRLADFLGSTDVEFEGHADAPFVRVILCRAGGKRPRSCTLQVAGLQARTFSAAGC